MESLINLFKDLEQLFATFEFNNPIQDLIQNQNEFAVF